MKYLEELQDRIFSHYLDFVVPNHINSDHIIVTVTCPNCNRYIDIERPDDGPPTGDHKCESWCEFCGGEFMYFY